MTTHTLILSTDGIASERYHSSSTEARILCPQVEEINAARHVGGPPHYRSRNTVHVELTLEQASRLYDHLATLLNGGEYRTSDCVVCGGQGCEHCPKVTA